MPRFTAIFPSSWTQAQVTQFMAAMHADGITFTDTENLRDVFAKHALQGILSSIDRIDVETWMKGMSHEALTAKYAHDAYMTADAMLKEREK